MSIGLIDVGSNTIRLSVYTVEGEGFSRLFGKKEMVGLASYVDDDGRLGDDGIEAACEALRRLSDITRNLHIDETHVFATASLRNIGNSAQALAAIEGRTGLSIELVSGEEEALLGYSSFRHDCPEPDGVMVDIGGGSSEIVRFQQGEPVFATSLPVGSLKLFKKCVGGIFPTAKERKALRRQVKKALDNAGVERMQPTELLCGIGGTARAVSRLIGHLHGHGEAAWDFTRQDLNHLAAVLDAGGVPARDLVLQACPDRVHTIVPGLEILQGAVDLFGCTRIHVSDFGVREGYLVERVIPTLHR